MRHPSYHQSCRYKDHSGSVKGVGADPDTAPQITLNPFLSIHSRPPSNEVTALPADL